LGGEIGFDSTPGLGSTFWFTAFVDLAAEQPRTDKARPDLHGLKALVLDDNGQAREVLTEILRSLGMAVSPLASPTQALDELQRADREGQPYGLVVTDWGMPEMNGIDFAAALQRMSLARFPLLLLATAYDRDEVRPQSEELGIREVLAKPVTPGALLAALARQFGEAWAAVGQQDQPGKPLAPIAALAGARALLVEDNELNQEVATEFLEALGLQVELASDGSIAVQKVRQQGYDVVLMDMQMPVMDGLSATREIRKLPGSADLPILAMTANAMTGDRERCLEAGMNDHIAKPIDPQDLQDKLRRWVKPAQQGAVRARVSPDDKALATVRAVRTGLEALAGIEGLDTRLGLAQVGGREALYLRLLSKLPEDQAGAADRLDLAMAASDWSEAERVAHTLKGVAAQIGALPLSDCAARLEQAIRQRLPAADLAPLLLAVRQALKPLLQAIAAALPQPDANAAPAAFDLQDWQRLRKRMIGLLRDSDSEVVPLFEANTELAQQGLGPRFDAVAQALSAFDFSAALDLIGPS